MKTELGAFFHTYLTNMNLTPGEKYLKIILNWRVFFKLLSNNYAFTWSS